MKNQKALQLLFEGRNLLKIAGEEMARAEEDVVSYLVCHNIRKGTENLLMSFLALNGEPVTPAPMAELLKTCRSYNSRFDTVDLTPIECKGLSLNQSDCHCTDLHKVQTCMTIARQVEQIIASTAMAY